MITNNSGLNFLELKQLITQCKELNILTLQDLKNFKTKYNITTNSDIINSINAIYCEYEKTNQKINL